MGVSWYGALLPEASAGSLHRICTYVDQTNVCSEAFSGHFGLFAEPQEDPVKRSSKTLAEGTQRVHADWTTTRNPGNSRLAEALAGRDRAHAALFACVFTTRTGEIGWTAPIVLKRRRRPLKNCCFVC